MSRLQQDIGTRDAAAKPVGRRSLTFSLGDRVALVTGIALTIALLAFFSWRMVSNVTRDRALAPAPMTVVPSVPE